MPRKVVLIRNVLGDSYGGAESYQLALSRMLSEYNIEPFILSNSKRLLAEAGDRNIKTIKGLASRKQNWSGIYNLFLPLYLVWIFCQFLWYITVFIRIKPDVINVQSRDDWLSATLAAKVLRIKVLWTDHMDFRSWVLQNVDVPYKNFIGKIIILIAKKADNIIFISDFEYKYFKSLKITSRLDNAIVIKNGVFDEYNRFLNSRVKKNSFAYIGRIVDYKGITELLAAFEAVSANYDVTLDIYGDGEDFEKYSKIARNNKRIIFHGYSNDPLKAMSNSRYFILPSYREGLSLSLLDAAMMGRCIIASDVDGNPEIIINKKTGLLVESGSVEDLEKAMRLLLVDDDLVDSLSRNVRKHYEKNFNFELIFKKQMLKLYEK